ncbi:MAG: rifampin glycosyltransferase, partial [Mycobacterium sp.]|nr:rifampin glycosyltransferase [Mycobacterium sp.]
MLQNGWPKPEPADMGVAKMRVLLSTWGSRGVVEPLLGLAVALREIGAEVRMCAAPDCAGLLARV